MAMMTNEAISISGDGTESIDGRRRNRFVWLSETAMVAACVLLFFAFLSALIAALFPHGSSLVADSDVNSGSGSSRSGEVELGIDAESGAVEQIFAAEILRIHRRVQRRAADTLTWNNVNVGDTVVRNDAVQTFARSTALVEVNHEARLTIGENSLIVFDQQQADPFLAASNSVLLMIDGELSGTLSGADKSGIRFGVNLPNSEVTLQPRAAGDDVQFVISVNDDQSTTVNIHEGAAQIVGLDGKRNTIGDNQSITIDSSGSEYRVTELTRAPVITGPANDKTVTYRNVPEQVRFTGNAVANADGYHIVVARDAEFSDRVVDDDVAGTTFTHGALGPGTYYWHVRSRAGWSQSDMTAARRLRVKQDLVPPVLELDPPPDTIQAGLWRLHGRTDADAVVFVDEVPIEHVDGRIDHPVELRPGANVIVVKAVDAVGNLSYASLLVNAK
jgi:hypothetical protein